MSFKLSKTADSFFTYMRKTQHLDINRRVGLEEKRHQRAMLIPSTEVKVIKFNSVVHSSVVSVCASLKKGTIYAV